MNLRLPAALLLYWFVSSAPPLVEARAQTVSVWTTDAMRKIRPNDRPESKSPVSASLEAAQNEFESFQVILRSSGTVEALDVTVSDFTGPGSSVIGSGNVAVYLQGYVAIETPSSVEGEAGEWPDPLLPRVDRYTHERRNPFPFRLSPGRNQPLWVEVYVPADATPGIYNGAVTIQGGSRPEINVPVRLRVWAFRIPSTSSLKTAFGISGPAILKQHFGQYTGDDDLRKLTDLYARAALLHRVSITGGTMIPPRFTQSRQGLRIDWTAYDREVGPFLDGTVFGSADPLPGARATTVDLRTFGEMKPEDKKNYIREWVRHFKEKGWYERLYNYLWDEPTPAQYPRLVENGRLVRQAEKSLPNLVTSPLHGRLAEVVDIWAPLINCFDTKPGYDPFCAQEVKRSRYEQVLKRGGRLWWYQSCGSHGCTRTLNEYFRGWPSYVIDTKPSAHRIMEWLSWTHRIEGELYYSMTEAYTGGSDPWKGVYRHSGNGDGTLFYPGVTARIGGSRDIPIESIRLKLIREGLEDYEYLVLLRKAGKRDLADRIAARIAPLVYKWEQKPEVLYAARREIARALNAPAAGAGADKKRSAPQRLAARERTD